MSEGKILLKLADAEDKIDTLTAENADVRKIAAKHFDDLNKTYDKLQLFVSDLATKEKQLDVAVGCVRTLHMMSMDPALKGSDILLLANKALAEIAKLGDKKEESDDKD